MADETTTTDAPVADAPVADTPAPEAPVTDTPAADTPVAPTDEVTTDGASTLDTNIGVTEAQVFGPPAPVQTVATVEESFFSPDRVITDHNDPAGTKDQFRGQSPPAPLPLGGANGDLRTADQKIAGL